MLDEEKEAVETLKDLASTIYYGDMNFIESDDLKIILNLIEKQQKEIDLCEETEIALNNRIMDLEEINKEHQKLNGELRKEIEELNISRKNGTLSDGYHTYNDLYYQRCVLFATICNMNKNISWKSARHSDGKKCFDSDNWFIVGIDTLEGSYTYHYEMKFWDMFKVPELEKGKEWDGHTEKDVTRLLSLEEE